MTRKPIHIEVAMPSGPDHYWREMLARPKGFTVTEIALASEGVANTTVKRYVEFLKAEGFVVRIGQKRDGYALRAIYAVAKRVTKAPVRRPDPLHAPFSAREAMWNAIRALDQFTVSELAVSASTEERPVAQRTADHYVRALLRAGVLRAVAEPERLKGHGSTRGVYRLVKSANTGPRAPKLCNAGFVFDPNKNRVLGEAVVTEARS
ncbi:hypothetical protein IY145_10905 [Methylosinus sp. H3A]|jgi:hypothetical protein|uniref:hypothetical protein n=1 Tax=Methylosinus sp. H3A TaxID=2785786 RepID=UPI0018C2B28F|nr:hypothetical protein [Methylosinus sp. H3A]MBG0809888.1 hypothetical protein [Methylosinus sp. H3A]